MHRFSSHLTCAVSTGFSANFGFTVLASQLELIMFVMKIPPQTAQSSHRKLNDIRPFLFKTALPSVDWRIIVGKSTLEIYAKIKSLTAKTCWACMLNVQTVRYYSQIFSHKSHKWQKSQMINIDLNGNKSISVLTSLIPLHALLTTWLATLK